MKYLIYLYLLAVLVVGVAYFTHPARVMNYLKARDKWTVILHVKEQ